MKRNKGITLVALIITIIVLLILAVVTIAAVNEGDLFAHANNAASAYEKAAREENSLIAGYLEKLGSVGGTGESGGETSGTERDLSGIYYSYDGSAQQQLTITRTGPYEYSATNGYGTFPRYA